MRYIIIGAGAIGGTIGALLSQSGHDVVLVARGQHLHALQTNGLHYSDPTGEFTLRLPAVVGPEELTLTAEDALILSVKSQDSEPLLRSWSIQPVGDALAGDVLPIFCAQNGICNEPLALRYFAKVYGMFTWLPATHLEPGVVSARSGPQIGVVALGRYPHGTDDTAREISRDLNESRLIAPVIADVMRWKRKKLLGNLNNALQAVTGDLDHELRKLITAEGQLAFEAAGLEIADQAELQPYLDQLHMADEPDPNRDGGSTWQSLMRGNATVETDALNGEIVLLGRLHDVPTPVNALLQRLANQAAAQGLKPGFLTTDQLRDALN